MVKYALRNTEKLQKVLKEMSDFGSPVAINNECMSGDLQGLNYTEALEMAYENLLNRAQAALEIFEETEAVLIEELDKAGA
jgi:hypothetical protein